jgi:tRNA (mo5U34)-methyltransferase
MAWQRTPTDDEPRELLARDRPWFQGWEIRPGISVPGPNDIAAIMDRAGVSHDLSGKRVLDFGAYNGCVSLECERRGASEVVWQNGTIYQLDPAIHGTFDVVICFGVLYNLRWPLLGIDRMRSVATGDVYLESHVIDRHFVHPRRWMRWLKEKELHFSSVPMWRAYAARELHPEDASNFFDPNTHAVVAALDDVGITTTCTGMWDDRASFASTVRRGRTRQQEVYESLHPHTAALMGIPLDEDPLF